MNYQKPVTFLLYFFVLSYIVFFSPGRTSSGIQMQTVHLIPFSNTIHSYHALTEHSLQSRLWFTISNFIGNIILFIPFPILFLRPFGSHDRRWVVGGGVLCSFLIEYLQFTLKIGVADIDDLLLNTTGIFTGIYLWKLHTRKHSTA